MVSYIKLPNNIVYGLTTAESMILVRLYLLGEKYGTHNMFGTDVKVRQIKLAEACNVTVKTVQRCTETLIKKGLILGKKRTVRYTDSGVRLSTYVYRLPKLVRYFKAPIAHLTLIARKASECFKLYLYACKCKNSLTGSFYHSYNDISSALSMKRSDIISRIKTLETLGVVNKYVKKTLSNRHTENTYVVLIFVRGKIHQKKNPPSQKGHRGIHNITCYYTLFFANVKSFLKKSLKKVKRVFARLE